MKIVLCFCFYMYIFCISHVHSQHFISLEKAIEIALQQNHQAKNEALKKDYLQKTKAGAFALEQTIINYEYGQFNSIYNDNKFGVSQVFAFPSVFFAQKKTIQAELIKANADIAQTNKKVVKNVSLAFYDYLILQEREKLLLQNDSIYEAFIEKASLKLLYGESSALEKISAETQHNFIRLQLMQIKQEAESILLELKFLLNTNETFVPQAILKAKFIQSTDSYDVHLHPSAKSAYQQIEIKKTITQLEKQKYLPNISLAYFNTSIRGMGSDENYYNSSARFQSVQIGLGIPLFFNGQKSKINASKTEQRIAENNYDAMIASLNNERSVALHQYEQNNLTLQKVESFMNDNYTRLINIAKQQVDAGEINVLQWIQLINQAMSIKAAYLNIVQQYNRSLIELEYLHND